MTFEASSVSGVGTQSYEHLLLYMLKPSFSTKIMKYNFISYPGSCYCVGHRLPLHIAVTVLGLARALASTNFEVNVLGLILFCFQSKCSN